MFSAIDQERVFVSFDTKRQNQDHPNDDHDDRSDEVKMVALRQLSPALMKTVWGFMQHQMHLTVGFDALVALRDVPELKLMEVLKEVVLIMTHENKKCV